MIEQLMNEYGYRESGTDDLLMPHVLTDSNSVGYGGGVESLTEGSWPFDQPSESNGPTPMATIDSQCYYGDGSDTGFELLEILELVMDTSIPYYTKNGEGIYLSVMYGLLKKDNNLPNFTSISIDSNMYPVLPAPTEEQPVIEPAYYLGEINTELIISQEDADNVAEKLGIDVQVGDSIVVIEGIIFDPDLQLTGNVPMILYAGQDSWSGTLHEYIETSASVYGDLNTNSDSTAYELTVYTDNASNPQYKINDGEWTAYDSSNKPELYLPGSYTFYLKATNNYDESEITAELTIQIQTYVRSESHIVENPSAMFAGLNFRVHLASNYSSSELTGRDDVVLLYKEQSAATWESAAMTSTSDGYFAEVETGWGHKAIEYKVQIDGVSDDVPTYREFDLLPMTPSFVDIINDQGTYYARFRFGADYPGMNTVETIEYSFDKETWSDAVHDSVSGYELAEIHGYGQQTIYFRTKLVSDSSVKSATVEHSFSILVPDQVVRNACTDIDGNTYDAVILGRQVWLGSNLRVTHYSDGTSIQNYKHANNDANNDSIYGLLYTYETYTRHFSENTDDSVGYLGAAPEGWHIPCMNDIYKLCAHVTQNYTSPAKDLASRENWQSSSIPNSIGDDLNVNNATGFNMQPSGRILSDDTPYGFLSEAILASSYRLTVTYEKNNSTVTQQEMRHLLLSYDLVNWLSGAQAPISNYFPVRCIYDGTPEEFLASLAQQQSSSDNNN